MQFHWQICTCGRDDPPIDNLGRSICHKFHRIVTIFPAEKDEEEFLEDSLCQRAKCECNLRKYF